MFVLLAAVGIVTLSGCSEQPVETIKIVEDTAKVDQLQEKLDLCEKTVASLSATGEIEAVETGYTVIEVFKDKKNNFENYTGGDGLHEANGTMVKFPQGITTGYLEFSVTTTEKDKKWTRNFSTFYMSIKTDQGFFGGHFADYIITNNDYGTVYRVPLDKVNTYMYMADMKAGRNMQATNFIDAINKGDFTFVTAFYNATKWASVQSLVFYAK